MPLSTATTTEYSYGTAKGWRIFLYLLVPPLIVVMLILPFLMTEEGWNGITIGFGILGWGLALFFVYGLVETYKARHIFSEQSIRYKGALRRKELPLEAVRGYRADDKYTYIVPVSNAYPSIRIGYTSEGYKEIQLWLAERFPNLDVQQQELEAQEILQDETLGRSVPEREEKLAQARQVARVLNTLAWAVAAWLFFYPKPYDVAVQASLGLPPVAALALLWYQGLLRADERKDSAYPALGSALFIPAVALMLRVLLDFELLDYSAAWQLAAAVAVLFGGVLAYGNRRFIKLPASRWGAVATVFFCALVYGYSAVVAINCVFDEATPRVYAANVISKHISSGKTTTYYLKVGAWGPRTAPEDVTVTEETYDQTMPGDSVRVYQFPGRLAMPWFTVSE
ncbi:hypothetical protein [Hymenobacter rigui]|uniref:DUF3592 domain-containing protein n=1 Tax=Hymenobacter rigui TaxID=334424 RepID=A0A428KWV1_9BACT|nr:hypothetical protein [Hymenobacter rigui]RSK51162.1 hypothetical protein EI291_02275 [Hymenobacter rigui]